MFLAVVRHVPLKRELIVVGLVLLFLIVLPVLAVTTILSNGIAAVSDSIVQANPVTHMVTVYNPDGSIKTSFEASTVWPVHGPVSLEFGADDSPYQAHHTGIDIAVPIGTPVEGFLKGTVLKTGYDTSEGKFVYIDHGNGIVSHYLHMSLVTVITGKPVNAGGIIGLSGNTGYSTGPHVHFEVRVNDIPTNPREFMTGNPN